jgi:hypothetical protein
LATIRISSDGVEFSFPDEIAADDDLVRQSLAPFYAELANADITRSEENGQMIVIVTKRAGTKGNNTSDVISALRAAPEEINPALVLQDKLTQDRERGKLTLRTLLRLQPTIRQAVDQGARQIEENSAALKLLIEARPVPGRSTPTGF